MRDDPVCLDCIPSTLGELNETTLSGVYLFMLPESREMRGLYIVVLSSEYHLPGYAGVINLRPDL